DLCISASGVFDRGHVPHSRSSVHHGVVCHCVRRDCRDHHRYLPKQHGIRRRDFAGRDSRIFVLATSRENDAFDFMKNRSSDYMNWAKLQSKARYNLATSGVGAFPLRELGITTDQLEINGDSTYGYAPLQQAIAAKCGVDPASVVAAAGTSMANHLAMAALLERGDEVLIEHPTYELLVTTAQYFDVSVKSFPRQESDGYAIDPGAIRKAVSPKTKLIVISNLHNPSSV